MRALFVFVLLCLLWWPWRKLNASMYGDAFSPFNLLFFFWICPFVLVFADLSGLQTAMGSYAVAIVCVSTSILAITCLLPTALLRNRSSYPFAPLSLTPRLQPGAIIAFLFITLVALYYAEFSDRDLPLIAYILGGASDPNLHTAGKDSKLQVIAFGIYPAAIFLFYLWLNESKRVLRVCYLTLSCLIIALGIAKASKSDIYIPILSYASLTYYHYRARNRRLPKVYLALLLPIVVGVISITSIRVQGVGVEGGYANAIEFRYADDVGDVASEIISIPYGYMALGFQNFANYVNSHAFEFRIGTSLFRPFLSALMMGDVANSLGVSVDEWSVVSDAANTGTLLTPLYIEGGALFCLMGALLYGLIVNLIYYRFRQARSSLWLFMYVSVIFPWTWMFFTNAFSVLGIYVNLCYVAVLSWLSISRRQPRQMSRRPCHSGLRPTDDGSGHARRARR